ncbi:MAG TPA: phosphatase PAP2 family protein [Acidimicrobiia bacterium]|nr:phosphatase PAP2 family protein [Acidimicrobiia bacterium]
MAVVAVMIAAGLLGGLAGTFAAWYWPAADVAAPAASAEEIEHVVRTRRSLVRLLRSHADPEASTRVALAAALLVLAACATAIGVLLVMVHTNSGLAHYDLSAARWGASHATHTSTRVLRDVSLLGGTPAMIIVAVAASSYEYVRSRRAAVFAFVALVVVGQVVVVNLTKVAVDRARPDISRLTGFSGASFPSGHAATAAATFAAAALLLGRGRSRAVRAMLSGAVGAIGFAVAATRVLLGVHWLTDVVAGLIIGWSWFALCSVAFGGRMLRFGQPVRVAKQTAQAVPGTDGAAT